MKLEQADWTPPALPLVIPIGDMPGDKVHIENGHIQKTNVLFPALLPILESSIKANPSQKAVISICGCSGVGKSGVASVLSYYLQNIGLGSYTLSGDNYPHRIPAQNDAERLRIYRSSGIRGLLTSGAYAAECVQQLKNLQLNEQDADPAFIENFPWLEIYQCEGRKGLAGYLGTPCEQGFDELAGIVSLFKNGSDKIWLKRMGRTETELWYEEIDFKQTKVLVIEWTHGNSDHFQGVDIPVLLNSTPQETQAYRKLRGRDGKTDSAFTSMVLDIEQKLLESQAYKAKLIVSKDFQILSFQEYKKLMAN
ncbi:MAG: adenylyl-sulfate kinase [Clostridiales bacterium]|nr:adenylyl-sulfate kinase [Clostridiales bacterium]MDR2750601.1 adenylyl-sulfate kinase [Clostridiales bacterium]